MSFYKNNEGHEIKLRLDISEWIHVANGLLIYSQSDKVCTPGLDEIPEISEVTYNE